MSSSVELPATTSVTCARCGEPFTRAPNQQAAICQRCADESKPEEALQTTNPNSHCSALSDDAPEGEIVVPSSIKSPDFRDWGNQLVADTLTTGVDGTPDEAKPPLGEGLEEASEFVEERSHLSQGKFAPAAPMATLSVDAIAPKDSPRPIPRSAFWGLLIYSSIVTALCLGLLYLALTNQRHQLESLPDVVPPRDAQGTIARELVPANAQLPAGHTLELGQTRRFGDLLVTPLKVSREPLTFTHYQGNQNREPAGEVLKLWLKFENVSPQDKAFSPLDANLLFYRAGLPGTNSFKANNYLSTEGDFDSASVFAVYDHPIGSDWNLSEQQLGTVLSRGDSSVTYVPSETGLPELAGQLVWRVHLRKGIAENGWGVTTLIDVTFSASQIHES